MVRLLVPILMEPLDESFLEPFSDALVKELWGEVKGNYGGPYYGGFSKSIQAFPKITQMYLYSLQMSFYDGSNSSSFTLDAVILF